MSLQYCPDPEDDEIVFNLPKGISSQSDNAVQGGLDLESSDDEGPEDVPFSIAKDSALAVIRAEKQNKNDVDDLQKKKRLKKEQKMLEQKESKAKRLEVMASKRLPDSLLEDIPEKPAHHSFPEKSHSKKMRKDHTGSHIRFESEHYIPLASEDSSTDFNVAILESRKWKSIYSRPGGSGCKSFRDQALSAKHIRRVPVSTLQQERTKQQTSGKFALIK